MASDLGHLPLLSAVIKEALRLCPPAGGGTRHVEQEEGAELCGYHVPKVSIRKRIHVLQPPAGSPLAQAQAVEANTACPSC